MSIRGGKTNASPLVETIRQLNAEISGLTAEIRRLRAAATDNYELGGEFTSFQNWVNKAQSWIGGRYAICIDAKGRVCGLGAHFMRSRDEEAFPVRYYFPVTSDRLKDD